MMDASGSRSDLRCGLTIEAWSETVTQAVLESTAAQALPELVEDDAVLDRVAAVFGPLAASSREVAA